MFITRNAHVINSEVFIILSNALIEKFFEILYDCGM